MTRTAIGASASGFETDLLSLEGIGKQRGGGMTVYQLPSFFGAVLGKDVIDSDEWRIGFTITKPILTYQNVDNLSAPWNQTFFSDKDATFDYRLPLDVSVGLAWRSKAFEAEFDLRYHGAISEYVLLSSTQPIRITTTDPATGFPVYTAQPFPGVTNGARTVWNYAFGGRYNLNELWSFHGGFYSDASPTNASGANLFRSVNMYGITAGAKVRGDHLSGSVGLGYSWGSSDPFEFGGVTGTPINTKLTITSLSLLYAVAYKF
jgi:long-subunit fatty acid transport protein